MEVIIKRPLYPTTISHTVIPVSRPTEEEWLNQFNVAPVKDQEQKMKEWRKNLLKSMAQKINHE